MKVLISGSRTWKKTGPIEVALLGLKALYPDLEVIVGDCPTGVDKIVWDMCQKHTILGYRFFADWKMYGLKAGPIRNREMVSEKPDLCYAFRDEGPSPGTDDCVRQAMEAGIPTYIIRKNATPVDMSQTNASIDFRKGKKQLPISFAGPGAN